MELQKTHGASPTSSSAEAELIFSGRLALENWVRGLNGLSALYEIDIFSSWSPHVWEKVCPVVHAKWIPLGACPLKHEQYNRTDQLYTPLDPITF